ncbi:endonuclease domain-containing 1 protein-like [Triplophysa dalaica]|uniref:endonuclease domain-containing 1 protein-like n=1 Tax=Triplophysa dalaica TaxID=1582913 RepID=UPI0024DFB1B5|nr:endonuclease domain-containing 1 protein-like [Triplophysa dalaica]
MMFYTRVSVLLLLTFPAVIPEVVDFSRCSGFFFEGKSPVITDILENSKSQKDEYKTICQKYKSVYRFATLFDTTNRIPVFSAYTVTVDRQIERPDSTWMNEPQLEVSSGEMGMPYENQATDEDIDENNSDNVNRGHLFPSCHSGDEVIARSTFTYTNTVPQKISFNGGSWKRMEIDTIQFMALHCRDKSGKNVLAHVLTGAVPGKHLLKYRVNIPSFMWMTFCCYNNKSPFSKAYWAPNEDEYNDNLTITGITLQELQKNLINNNIKVTQLFDKDCT